MTPAERIQAIQLLKMIASESEHIPGRSVLLRAVAEELNAGRAILGGIPALRSSLTALMPLAEARVQQYEELATAEEKTPTEPGLAKLARHMATTGKVKLETALTLLRAGGGQ